jgi:hypothetical protein
MDAIALFPGYTPVEGWHILSIDTGRVIRRSNFQVCSKYSERAIRFLADLAIMDFDSIKGVERHQMDIDRVQDSTPRISRELIADPLEVETSDESVLGAVLMEVMEEVDVSFIFQEDRSSIEGVLTSVWQEAEAQALVFLAQYSLLQGISMYGEKAISAVKDELTGLIDNLVGEPKRWEDVPRRARKKVLPTKMILRDYLLGYAIPQKGCVGMTRADGR